MATVIVEMSIKVVDDEQVASLYKETIKAGDDRVEIPDLPGVDIQNVRRVFKGSEPIDFDWLREEIEIANKGETPTATIFTRRKNDGYS